MKKFFHPVSENNSCDHDPFQQKLNELKKRWLNKADSSAKRLYSKIVNNCSDLSLIALLKNDRVAFDHINQNVILDDDRLTFLFEAACLCGADTIAQNLIDSYHYDISHSEDALAYALSTGNFDFAYHIAEQAKACGKDFPGNLYLYNSCTFSELNIIKSLFTLPVSENPQAMKNGLGN